MAGGKNRLIARVLVQIPHFLVLYILQGIVFSRIPILGIKPLILPLAVAGAALFRGRVGGAAAGLFAGMLCDLSFNQPTIQFTVILTMLGFLIGYLADSVLVKGFPSYFVLSLLTLSFCSFCQIFRPLFFAGAPAAPLIIMALNQTLVSMIFAIPNYYISRFINRIM